MEVILFILIEDVWKLNPSFELGTSQTSRKDINLDLDVGWRSTAEFASRHLAVHYRQETKRKMKLDRLSRNELRRAVPCRGGAARR